jgi:hypothetical protein
MTMNVMLMKTLAMPVAGTVLATLLLSACGAASPRRPYDSMADNRLLMQQCQDAQLNQTLPPPQCPQATPAPATRRRAAVVPDVQDAGSAVPPPTINPPMPSLPRLPR